MYGLQEHWLFIIFWFLSGSHLFGMFTVGGVTTSNQHWNIYHRFANVICDVLQLS
jgi:hypothetical protein